MRNGRAKLPSPSAFLLVAITLPLSLANSGCFIFGRKAKPAPPTVVISQPIILTPPPVTNPLPAQPPVPENPPRKIPTGNATRSTRPPMRRRGREYDTSPSHHPGAVSRTTADTPPSHPDESSFPLLTPGLTPSQQQEYRNSTVGLLNQARQDLRVLNGRNLSSEQVATRTQASEWVRQAQIALNQGDLVRAQNLARKAAVLTRALFEQSQ